MVSVVLLRLEKFYRDGGSVTTNSSSELEQVETETLEPYKKGDGHHFDRDTKT